MSLELTRLAKTGTCEKEKERFVVTDVTLEAM